jgi:hypothetical protein
MISFGFRVLTPLNHTSRSLRHEMPFRIILWFFFLLFTQSANSQKLNDYVRLLTSGIKQSWRLDSVTLNSSYGAFKKGAVLLFKLSNEVIVSEGSMAKKERITWLMDAKDGYALLDLGETGYFEIDFLEKNKVDYMRLRNQLSAKNNSSVLEYYFVKSN